MGMNQLRLQWKIFAFLVGFCALLLLILWLFQTVLLEWFYQNIKLMEIKNSAKAIVQNLEDEDLPSLLTSLAENGEFCIEIMSEDGTTLHSEDVLRDCMIHKIAVSDKLKLISLAQSKGGELYKYIERQPPPRPSRNGRYINSNVRTEPKALSLLHIRLTTDSDGKTVALFMNLIITPVSATVTTLRYQLYFVTGIMLALSVFLAVIIAKRVSKPIEDINKGAKALADGRYQTHFDGKGFLEITELSDTLNAAAAELSKVEALRRELMANISHDLRTPLSLIYSYAEMMHDFPGEITPEHTQMIMNETQRLSSLVNDIFDISQLETGNQNLKLSEFSLTQNLKATTERMSELLKKDGYQIIFRYDKDVTVRADEVKITQAFYNLLINAINYAGADKTVEVTQSLTASGVRVDVSDAGEGIAPEALPYIWNRYYKAEKKHTRAITGTGLGLSIVKMVLELHGGTYGVESQVGIGSTFWFGLPHAGSDQSVGIVRMRTAGS